MVSTPVLSFLKSAVEDGGEDLNSFLVIDTDDIRTKRATWKTLFPRIAPFYAVKCNDDPVVLKTLVETDEKMCFDCASISEITAVLSYDIEPEQIIYANPCKQISHLCQAAKLGVRMMTFDNVDELRKINEFAPESRVVMRLATDDSKSKCTMSEKYGVKLADVSPLLEVVVKLELDFVGFSYHVGSGCDDERSFVQAIRNARKAFDIADKMGVKCKLLDIGGGFSGDKMSIDSDGNVRSVVSFTSSLPRLKPSEKQEKKALPEIARSINAALDLYFPESEGYRIIAEPGRFFVQSAGVLATRIIARRKPRNLETQQVMYYISEGVYGPFSNMIYDHAIVYPHILPVLLKASEDEETGLSDSESESSAESSTTVSSRTFETKQTHRDSCIWGPTSDGIDCVVKTIQLPLLKVGSWFYFQDMGAYTLASGSNYNGFESVSVIAWTAESKETEGL